MDDTLRVLAQMGGGFSAGESVGALAANYSMAQAWNPVGSGKTAFLAGCSVTAGSTGLVRFLTHNAALTSSGTVGKTMPSGGALSINAKYQQHTSYIGTTYSYIGLTIDQPLWVPFPVPVVLEPGYGMVFGGPLNTSIRAMFYGWEM